MIEKDKQEFRSIICDAIDEVISPQLEEIRDELSGVKEDVSGLKEDVSGLKEDVSGLKEDVSELKDTTDRIERRINSEISRADDHSIILNQHTKRLTKLEVKA